MIFNRLKADLCLASDLPFKVRYKLKECEELWFAFLFMDLSSSEFEEGLPAIVTLEKRRVYYSFNGDRYNFPGRVPLTLRYMLKKKGNLKGILQITNKNYDTFVDFKEIIVN